MDELLRLTMKDRDRWHEHAIFWQKQAEEKDATIKRLKMEFVSVVESLVEWGAYVDDYYKRKWDFDKTVEQIKQSAGEN